jgi:hypothetical protein
VSEVDTQAALAELGEAAVTALASVGSTNLDVAKDACVLLTRISTSFLLNCVGEEAAKHLLASTWAALQDAICAREPPARCETITPQRVI